jgi:PKD repeat protein
MLKANFLPSEYFGNAPFTVRFTNTSEGEYVNAAWNFGDGNTSSQINPVHTFSEPGNYYVILNIQDSNGETSSFSKELIVFAIDDDETTQDLLEIFKEFNSGEVAVLREYITGSEFETRHLIYDGNSELSTANISFWIYTLNGDDINHSTNEFRITGTSFASQIDNILSGNNNVSLALLMNDASGSDVNTFANRYDGGYTCPQILFYNVVDYDIVGSPNYIEVDRPLPNLSRYNVLGCIFSRDYENIVASNIKAVQTINCVDSFDSLDYMPIDAGNSTLITDGSYTRGQMNYYGYNGSVGRSITVLSTIGTGSSTEDSYFPGSVFVQIPWVRWHRDSVSSGVKLYDSVDTTAYDPATESRFRYLRDGTSTNSKIVGKVYYDNKSIVIDDPELSTMFNYVSNRSYTLPPLSLSTQLSNAWTNTATTYYMTYQIFDSGGTRSMGSFGLDPVKLEPMHCRYIQSITPSVSSSLNVQVEPLYGSVTGTTEPQGYIPYKLKLLMATGSTVFEGPDSDSWAYVYEAIWTGNTGGSIVSITADPYATANYTSHTLFESSGFNASNAYIGIEDPGMVYISGNYESSIYKVSAVAVAKSSEFNQTQNKTWNNGSVYISEVGIYNNENDLIMVGKLSKPIEKNSQKYVTVKLELDI